MDKYYELLLQEKFNIVEEDMKKLLEKYNNNSEYWYLLFLACNDNYINLYKYSINNEIAFNKAIEYASFKEEIRYKYELDLYKGLSNNKLNKLFRLYQFKKYNICNKILQTFDEKIDIEITDKLLDSIKYIFDKPESKEEIEIQIKLYELLYKLSNNEIINKLIKEIKNDNFYNYIINKDKYAIYDEHINELNDKLKNQSIQLNSIKNKNFSYEKELNNKKNELLAIENKILELKKGIDDINQKFDSLSKLVKNQSIIDMDNINKDNKVEEKIENNNKTNTDEVINNNEEDSNDNESIKPEYIVLLVLILTIIIIAIGLAFANS